eukprot:216462-Amphidinium_carterae.1
MSRFESGAMAARNLALYCPDWHGKTRDTSWWWTPLAARSGACPQLGAFGLVGTDVAEEWTNSWESMQLPELGCSAIIAMLWCLKASLNLPHRSISAGVVVVHCWYPTDY